MKFKDMPYKRVDYDKTAEQFKTLTKRVKEAKSGEELWEIHQEYYKVSNSSSEEVLQSVCENDSKSTFAVWVNVSIVIRGTCGSI